MNRVARATITIPRRAPTRATIQVRALPFILKLALYGMLVFPILSVVMIGLMTLARLAERPSDPLSIYREVLPGQSESAVMAREFSCYAQPPTADHNAWCTYGPTGSPFYLVYVTLKKGIITRIDFAARKNALMVGDLPRSWGRPEIQLYGKSAILKWPEVGVSANGWTESGQFSYFMPVVRLSLAAQATT